MVWKLLLPTLVMFVSIHETIGQGAPQNLPPPPPVLSDGPGPVCSVDVVFLIDESSSISSYWFKRGIQFIVDFVNCFTRLHNIGIGIIPYNCLPRTHFPLGSSGTINCVQKGGLSYTGKAIRYMKDTSDFRDGVPRSAVVMTDGWSTDNFAAEAAAAMADGIKLYAVRLGDPGLVDNPALETIAGSPDRVFNTDIPCKVAFRILADLCKLSGVPGCYWDEKIGIMPLGSSYNMRPEECGQCDCSENGHYSCWAVGCPLKFPPCQNHVPVATWCCPACADYGEVPDGCLYNGEIIPLGEEYKPDHCTTCTCPAAGAEPECVVEACPEVYCPNPVRIMEQCCPICPGCLQGDVLIPVGATYEPDPCTFCSCPYAGATPMCAVMDCAPPPCANYVVLPRQCCPVCPPVGCQHADGLILVDDTYWPDSCTECSCPGVGMEPVCYPTPGCAPPPCDDGDYIRLPDRCCPECDTNAPGGCWLHGGSDLLIPVGVDYALPADPCVVCTCPLAGGAVVCTLTPCPPPGCPNPVHIAGVCCPICNL